MAIKSSDFNLGADISLSKERKESLMASIKVDPYYLPPELFTKKERVAGERAMGSGEARVVKKRARGGDDNPHDISSLLEKATSAEQRAAKDEGDAEGEPKKRKPGSDEEEEDEVEDEDDEYDEDDDYLQGNHYDDDEGYEDEDDGGDEGGYY